MARGGRGRRGGRGGGGGGIDTDIFYDSMYSLQVLMPQGLIGNQFIYNGSEAGFITRVNNMT